MRSIDTARNPRGPTTQRGRRWAVAAVAAACTVAVVGAVARGATRRAAIPAARSAWSTSAASGSTCTCTATTCRADRRARGRPRLVLAELVLGPAGAGRPHVRVVVVRPRRTGLERLEPGAARRRDHGGPSCTRRCTPPASTDRTCWPGTRSAGWWFAPSPTRTRPETAGLVLVDASHPDQWARWPVPYADRIQLAHAPDDDRRGPARPAPARSPRSPPSPPDCPTGRSPSSTPASPCP